MNIGTSDGHPGQGGSRVNGRRRRDAAIVTDRSRAASRRIRSCRARFLLA